MMRRKGFPSKWLSAILSSGTSQVLLNGVPGKTIHCRKGVQQGDPLSHLVIVLAADLLQSLINAAYLSNLISLPLGSSYGQAYPIVKYADNTLIIMPTEAKQLFFLKVLLHTFACSTCLKVNFSKSFLVPINIPDEKSIILAGPLGCQVESMPFTYLGLPLGHHKAGHSGLHATPLEGRTEINGHHLICIICWSAHVGKFCFIGSAYLLYVCAPPAHRDH
jgi:hypothetical protein